MKHIRGLDDAVTPMYLASLRIRIDLTGSPLKRPGFSGFGFDRVLARHLPLGSTSYLRPWRTGVHRV